MLPSQFAILLLIVAFYCAGQARADDKIYNLDFQRVTLSELLQVYFKGILKADYIITPDALSDDREISVNIRAQTKESIQPRMVELFRTHGIEYEQQQGIYFIRKAAAASTVPATVPLLSLTPSGLDQEPSELSSVDLSFADKPLEPRVYRPAYRPVEFLSSALQFAGATVPQTQAPDTLLFSAQPDKVDSLLDLLSVLDTPPREIMVKAYLYEVSRTEKEGGGFNAALNLLNGRLGVKLAGGTLANSLTLTITDMQAVFSAFQSDDRFQVISSPSLRVMDGKHARFSVGSEVPVLDSVVSTATASTQSITYRPSGIILDIKPLIRGEKIDLELTQQMSNFQPTTNGVNNSPTLIKRELVSTVSVKDGEIVMLGGLDESRKTQGATGLRWLPSIFHTKQAEEGKTDILLILQVQKI